MNAQPCRGLEPGADGRTQQETDHASRLMAPSTTSIIRPCTSSQVPQPDTTDIRPGSSAASRRKPSRTDRWKESDSHSNRSRAPEATASRLSRRDRLVDSSTSIITVTSGQQLPIVRACIAWMKSRSRSRAIPWYTVVESPNRSQITAPPLRRCGSITSRTSWARLAPNNSNSASGHTEPGLPKCLTSFRICSPNGVPPGSRTVTTSTPRLPSASDNSVTCVDLPDASGPSRLMNNPSLTMSPPSPNPGRMPPMRHGSHPCEYIPVPLSGTPTRRLPRAGPLGGPPSKRSRVPAPSRSCPAEVACTQDTTKSDTSN